MLNFGVDAGAWEYRHKIRALRKLAQLRGNRLHLDFRHTISANYIILR